MSRTLILTAMQSEFADLLKTGQFVPSGDVWEGHNLTVALIGVGPINAAINLTKLLLKKRYDQVVLLGIGGALDPKLQVGDVIMATSIVQHDAICSFENRNELMAAGHLHLSLGPYEVRDIHFETDPDLNSRLEAHLGKVHKGTILSGSEFVGALKRKQRLKETIPTALLVDMEACSVAYICYMEKIPFTVVKTVADTLNTEGAEEYRDFISSSAKQCVDVVKCLSEPLR